MGRYEIIFEVESHIEALRLVGILNAAPEVTYVRIMHADPLGYTPAPEESDLVKGDGHARYRS